MTEMMKSTPRAAPPKKVFLINSQLAGKYFKINPWMGKFKEHRGENKTKSELLLFVQIIEV